MGVQLSSAVELRSPSSRVSTGWPYTSNVREVSAHRQLPVAATQVRVRVRVSPDRYALLALAVRLATAQLVVSWVGEGGAGGGGGAAGVLGLFAGHTALEVVVGHLPGGLRVGDEHAA